MRCAEMLPSDLQYQSRPFVGGQIQPVGYNRCVGLPWSHLEPQEAVSFCVTSGKASRRGIPCGFLESPCSVQDVSCSFLNTHRFPQPIRHRRKPLLRCLTILLAGGRIKGPIRAFWRWNSWPLALLKSAASCGSEESRLARKEVLIPQKC